MAAMRELHCSTGPIDQRPQWAASVRPVTFRQDRRCAADIGSFEPKMVIKNVY